MSNVAFTANVPDLSSSLSSFATDAIIASWNGAVSTAGKFAFGFVWLDTGVTLVRVYDSADSYTTIVNTGIAYGGRTLWLWSGQVVTGGATYLRAEITSGPSAGGFNMGYAEVSNITSGTPKISFTSGGPTTNASPTLTTAALDAGAAGIAEYLSTDATAEPSAIAAPFTFLASGNDGFLARGYATLLNAAAGTQTENWTIAASAPWLVIAVLALAEPSSSPTPETLFIPKRRTTVRRIVRR